MLNKYFLVSTVLCLLFHQYAAYVVDDDNGFKRLKQLLCEDDDPEVAAADWPVGNNSWPAAPLEAPEQDDLDRFLVEKTGCKYRALARGHSEYPPEEVYDGAWFEWHGAVRGGDALIQFARWGLDTKEELYNFLLGEEGSNSTLQARSGPGYSYKAQFPGVLSRARYTPFFVRLTPESLSFGKLCQEGALVTLGLQTANNTRLQVPFHPWSDYGAKFLVDCPADLEDIRQQRFHPPSDADSHQDSRGGAAAAETARAPLVTAFLLLGTRVWPRT